MFVKDGGGGGRAPPGLAESAEAACESPKTHWSLRPRLFGDGEEVEVDDADWRGDAGGCCCEALVEDDDAVAGVEMVGSGEVEDAVAAAAEGGDLRTNRPRTRSGARVF